MPYSSGTIRALLGRFNDGSGQGPRSKDEDAKRSLLFGLDLEVISGESKGGEDGVSDFNCIFRT